MSICNICGFIPGYLKFSLAPMSGHSSPYNQSATRMPDLVYIILTQLARMYNEGEISESDLNLKLSRLDREELTPRGLRLERRPRTNGKLDFLVTGAIPNEPVAPA